MALEDNIFKHALIREDSLLSYGFCKSDGKWIYTSDFLNHEFQAVIQIDTEGHIRGCVYENANHDIYLPLRVEGMEGFASQVRQAYIQILEDIKNKCCRENLFIYQQANRLTQHIYQTYHDKPLFPWDDFSGAVFKNPNNGKWYAIIMKINFKKIDSTLSGEIEVVNIKLEPEKIKQLHQEKGFYPAYHMNKKNWITVALNDTVSDEVLFELLQESYSFTLKKHPRI